MSDMNQYEKASRELYLEIELERLRDVVDELQAEVKRLREENMVGAQGLEPC